MDVALHVFDGMVDHLMNVLRFQALMVLAERTGDLPLANVIMHVPSFAADETLVVSYFMCCREQLFILLNKKTIKRKHTHLFCGCYTIGVWKDNVRKTLSEVEAALRQTSRPDCRSMIPTVQNIIKEVQKQNGFREVKPGDSLQMMNPMVSEILTELEKLEAALSVDDAAKALEHTVAALRLVSPVVR